MISLYGRKLFVPRRRTPRKCSNDIGIDTDLFGDVIEHDRRQHFAPTQISAWITQAAKLKGVAQPRCWRATSGNQGKIGIVEAVVPNHLLLGAGQRQKLCSLPFCHGNACRHQPNPFTNVFPFVIELKEDFERRNRRQGLDRQEPFKNNRLRMRPTC